ncbi:MAG: response regulator transcription factor [Myxococcota bacterium]
MGDVLVLIVDDERDLVHTLRYSLEREGYQTRVAYSGEEALAAARKRPLPSLVLLDLMLPDISGMDVCRALKQNAETRAIPVVMLTAKSAEIDRVVGFELGADDYVTKPFSVRELLLRLRAILRRAPAAMPVDEVLDFGCLRVDRSAHRVWVEEVEVTLTALEFRLVELLLERRGRVQSRSSLLEDVWGVTAEITTRTVDTHVKRLRQKLGKAGDYLETVRSVGYRWRPSPNEDAGV